MEVAIVGCTNCAVTGCKPVTCPLKINDSEKTTILVGITDPVGHDLHATYVAETWKSANYTEIEAGICDCSSGLVDYSPMLIKPIRQNEVTYGNNINYCNIKTKRSIP